MTNEPSLERLVRVVADVERCNEEVSSVRKCKLKVVHDPYFQIDILTMARVALQQHSRLTEKFSVRCPCHLSTTSLKLLHFSWKSVEKLCLAVKGPCDLTNNKTLFRQLYMYLVTLWKQ